MLKLADFETVTKRTLTRTVARRTTSTSPSPCAVRLPPMPTLAKVKPNSRAPTSASKEMPNAYSFGPELPVTNRS